MSEVTNYPNKPKEETADREKKVEKVVSGNVRVKKKSELMGMIVSEDVSNVKSYLLKDVLIPSLKKLTSELVTSFVDGLLFGGSQNRNNERRTNSSYVSYNRYSDRKEVGRRDSYQSNNSRSIGDFIFDNRGEAEYVLSQMDDMLNSYGLVSVSDLYSLIGDDCPYTYEKFGWTNLRSAEVVRVRDGYLLKLPKASPID